MFQNYTHLQFKAFIMNWLIINLTLFSLLLLSLPTIFKLLFIYFLGFNQASIKLKHPFHYVGILLQKNHPLWGIAAFTVYISGIKISLSLKSVKMNIILKKPKFILNRSFYQQLEQIKLLEANQHSKILKNLLTILKNQNPKKKAKQKSTEQNKENQKTQNRLLLASRAATQFIVLLFMQFIDVSFQQCQVCLVTALPSIDEQIVKKYRGENSQKQLRQMLMLQQCVTEQLITIPKLKIGASVQRNYELQILFECPLIKIMTSRHMQQTLLHGDKIQVRVRFPFAFSLEQSLKRMNSRVSIENIHCNANPVDFQDIFHIFSQISFQGIHPECQQRDVSKEKIKNDNEDEDKIEKNLSISIRCAELRLKDLAESSRDTKQAMKYLSNIAYGVLKIESFTLKENDIKIVRSKLGIYKYTSIQEFEEQQFSFIDKKTNENQLIHRDIFQINNLSILKESSKSTIISHDEVIVTCQKQQVSLLGKLFILINDRLSCQEYSPLVYEKQYSSVIQYIQGKLDLQQCILKVLNENSAHTKLSNNFNNSDKESKNLQGSELEQSSLVYAPKHIEFLMNISQLQHRIDLTGSKYRQRRSYSSDGKMQISHELILQRIHMQYQGIKQFHVNDFKLFYNQSPDKKQLSIFTEDIHMAQNFQTLKDYLVGFVIFKQLLQLGDEEQNEKEKDNFSGKLSKKTVRFSKIVLNYADQILILRKLQVDKSVGSNGKLIELYFSLGKCELIMSKIGQTHFPYAFREANALKISQHSLLSLASVTIKTFLASNSQLSEQKQKSMIHIKSPVFLLPETSIAANISERLINYIKIFDRLEPYITAYIMNKSKEKIRAMRNNYKKFMSNTDYNLIKVTNILVGIEDGILNRSMLNRLRFYREYYRFSKNYNESEILNYLKQTKKVYNLFEITIQTLSIQLKPIQKVMKDSEKQVQSWIKNLQKTYLPETSKKGHQSRLIRAKNAELNFELKFLTVSIRDYILPLMVCQSIKGSFSRITTKNIYEQVNHYIRSDAKIGDVQINTGLCLLSGLREVYKNLKMYDQALNKYKNTSQFLEGLRLKKDLEKVRYKPYWHIMHKSTHWYINIQKREEIVMKILTGLTPYSQKHIQIVLGPLNLESTPIQTSIFLDYLRLTTNKFLIFEFASQKYGLRSIYKQPYLQFTLQVDISSNSQKPDKTNVLKFSDQIIKDLSTIKQLKTDWLTIYNLVEPQSVKQADILHSEQNQVKYLNLFKMAANMQLKNKEKQLSIFSVIKNFTLKCQMTDFSLELSDSRNKIEFIFDQFQLSMKSEAKFEEWRMVYFNLKFENIMGRVKVFKGKETTELMCPREFIKLFHNISQKQLKKSNHHKQMFKQVFFVARKVILQLRKFVFIEKDQLCYVYKYVEINNIKLQISIELKKVIEYLTQTLIFEANKKISQLEEKKKFFKRSPIQKLRDAVILVMRMNRRKKKIIKTVKLFTKIHNIEIGLRTSKRLLLLTSRQTGSLLYNEKYHEKDRYHIDPRIMTKVKFVGLEVWVDQHSNHFWIFGKQPSPNNYLKAFKVLNSETVFVELFKQKNEVIPQQYETLVNDAHIQRQTDISTFFRKGEMLLTRDNLWILREISEIMIELVDSREGRRKMWNEWRNKYAEMIEYSRESIKHKLEWGYSDLYKIQNKLRLKFRLLFSLDEFDIILFEKDEKQSKIEPFLRLQSSNIQAKVNFYDRNKSEKEFIIHRLKIVNLQQLSSQPNPYSTFLEMTGDDSLAVAFKLHQYDINAYNSQIFWDFTQKAAIRFNPLKIRITEQIYTSIYVFFFGSKPDEERETEAQLQSLIPDYYYRMIIEEVKAQVWYRTQSMLKRLDGVNIQLQKFEMSNEFINRQAVFDRWVRFMVRQLASQFFNVIGQKIFG